jgi:hypothetical protein
MGTPKTTFSTHPLGRDGVKNFPTPMGFSPQSDRFLIFWNSKIQ